MPFSTLRPQSQVFIFHKCSTPTIEVGCVENVTNPQPKFNAMAQPFQMNNEMVVDVSVRIGGTTQNFQRLPANSDIADFGGFNDIVIATNRESMNSEILNYRQRSVDVIASIDNHKSIIEGCDNAYRSINPELDKQRQEDEIRTLKAQMGDMTKNIDELMRMNKSLLERLDVENGNENKKK